MADEVVLREVAPRDGLQNEPRVLPTRDKVALVRALAAAGIERVELTSFVRPDRVPQLADAEEVLRSVALPPEVARSVLVPNERGLDRALACPGTFDEVSLVVSASERHNRANLNASIDATLAGLARVAARARAAGLRCQGVVSVAFGCPYEGRVAPDRLVAIAERLAAAGVAELALGDTTGMANPVSVRERFARVRDAVGGEVQLTAHFHNTRGQGLANALAAYEAGVRSFEASVGELGGCPVPPGATGNVATEDLVGMFEEMGVRTRIDLDRLLDAARLAESLVGRPLESHVLRAGPVDWRDGT